MATEVPGYTLNQRLFEGATEYEHYTVIDSNYNNRPARMLYTDNQTAAQSGLPFDGKPEMLFDYNERFMELVRGLSPKSVLVIGGGAFTLPMAIHQYLPGAHIDVYELDGGLINISQRFFGFKQDQKLKVHIGDGRHLLKMSDNRYDLILVDVFNSTDVPKDFNQPELPGELKDRLAENGVVAMNIIAAYHGMRAEVLKKLEESFKQFHKEVKVYPAGSAISLWMSQNFLVVAGKNLSKASASLSYKAV